MVEAEERAEDALNILNRNHAVTGGVSYPGGMILWKTRVVAKGGLCAPLRAEGLTPISAAFHSFKTNTLCCDVWFASRRQD